jgi:hypothetical protein
MSLYISLPQPLHFLSASYSIINYTCGNISNCMENVCSVTLCYVTNQTAWKQLCCNISTVNDLLFVPAFCKGVQICTVWYAAALCWHVTLCSLYVVCPKSKCTDFLLKCLLDSPEITSYLFQSTTLGKLQCFQRFSHWSEQYRKSFSISVCSSSVTFFVCFPTSQNDDLSTSIST